MYFLMNKNIYVGTFIDVGTLEENYKFVECKKNNLPIGMEDINLWLERRKASKHNASLKKLMQECGCSTKSGFIKVTHAASLNDTFWVKSDKEDVTWEDISLYRNNFNETISKLAFEGIGLYGLQFSDTSPELSTEGSFKKCWKREDGDIFLYKRGSEGARNSGLEPYGEVMASEIASQLCKNAVNYDLVYLHKKLASKCKLFSSEELGYVPMARLPLKNKSLDNLLTYYESIDSEDDFRRMIVLDSITFNVDRHLGNFGVLIDNDTQKILKIAPEFDLNLAMLPYIEKEEFNDIGDKLAGYEPRLGNDFTRIGQLLLTSEIRSDLINLKGFEFSFQGDEVYTSDRVKKMEEIVEKQISGILSKDILFTKDVFITSHTIENETKEKEGPKENPELEKLSEKLKREDIGDVYIGINENDEFEITIVSKNDPNITFLVNGNLEMEILENDEMISYDSFLLNHAASAKDYMKIAKTIDSLDVIERPSVKGEIEEAIE